MTTDRNDGDRKSESPTNRGVPRRMRDHSDLELAELAKALDRKARDEALAELLQRHHRRLVSVAKQLVRSEDVEDIVQETYVSVVRDLPRYNPDVGSIETWTATILRRRAIDLHRKKRAHPPTLPTAARADTDDEMADEDRGPARVDARLVVDELLPKLGPRAREAVELRYVHDLDHAEIAKRMGITKGSVKTTLNRALRKLGPHVDR